MDPAAYVFAILVIVLVGALTWSRIIRPGLEDAGLLQDPADGPTASMRVPLPAALSRDTPAAYVADGAGESIAAGAAVRPFEPAELPLFVPPVQLLNSPHMGPEDVIRIDTMARLLAAGQTSESAAIVAVYDGQAGVPRVSKGGSAAYVARRDALRALAAHYGWRPPTPAQADPRAEARRIPINGGRDGYVEV